MRLAAVDLEVSFRHQPVREAGEHIVAHLLRIEPIEQWTPLHQFLKADDFVSKNKALMVLGSFAF